MDMIYESMLQRRSPIKAKREGSSTSVTTRTSSTSTKIEATFNLANSGIYKQVTDLVKRTTREVMLTKITITRVYNRKFVELVIDLYGEGDVLLLSSSDKSLLSLTDAEILERINVEVQGE